MPSAAWLAAAKESPRDMVAYLSIESVDAIKAACTTKADWDGAKILTNLNSATEPGTLYLVTDGDESYSGEFQAPTISPNALTTLAATTDYIPIIGTTVAVDLQCTPSASFNDRTVKTDIQFDVYPVQSAQWYNDQHPESPLIYYGDYFCEAHWRLWGSLDGAGYQILTSGISDRARVEFDQLSGSSLIDMIRVPTVHETVSLDLARGQWQFKVQIYEYVWRERWTAGQQVIVTPAHYTSRISARLLSHTDAHRTLYVPTGSTQTRTIDLGTVPTVPSRLEFDDFVPGGSTLTYTARGSSDGSAWTSLGTVEDGQSVPPYRYYDFTASFSASSDGMKSPFLHEIRVVGGDSQFVRVGTHQDEPVQGILPYISSNIGALTSRLELAKVTTGGELSLKFFYNAWVADLIARGGLRNRAVTMMVGFRGLSESDYEPYFVGTAYDYQLDHVQQEVTLRCRDVWKRFKRQIPTETVDASGNKTTAPITWTGVNVLQVMLDIVDYIDVPDRYINRPSFTAIRDGARSGADWQVTRTLEDPVEALQLLGELTEVAGVFLTIGNDGKLTATTYDPSAAPVDQIDARHVRVRKIESGDTALTTRQLVYYSLIAGETGGAAADYAKAHILINADVETDQGEVVEKEYFDKWGMSANAIIALANRRNEWYGQPLHKVFLEEVPPWHAKAAPGQVVTVDGLPFPAPAAMWGKLSYRKKFLTMVRTPDPNNGFVAKMELLEIIRNATFRRSSTAYSLDGSLVKAGVPRYEAGYGNGGMSIYVEEGTTNLCPANMANASELAMFTGDAGSTLSLEQSFPLFDLVSLKIATAGGTADSGGYTALLNVSASTVYSGQVVLKGSGQVDVYLRSYLADGVTTVATSTKTTVTLSNTPQRVLVQNFNTGASAAKLKLIIRSTTTAAISVVADRFQVEQKAYCTSWYPGTRGGETLTVSSAGLLAVTEGTVAMRVYVDSLVKRIQAGVSQRLINIDRANSAASFGIFLAHNSSTANWYFGSTNDGGTASYLTTSSASDGTGWHHFAVTWNSTAIKLVIDGLERASIPTPNLPSALGLIGIGCIGNGSAFLDGRIDDIWFSTKARSARQIADDYRTGLLIPTTGETIHLIDFDNNREIKQVTV